MSTQIATRGQAERALSQQIQALYRDQLGHRPGKITCQLFDEKLAIVIEDSVTQPEQLLAEDGNIELAEQVREDLDSAIRPRLKSLIETVLQVNVLDLLSDATLETGRTGMIVVLEEPPPVRPSTSRKAAKKGGQNDPKFSEKEE
ncbi:DUF2294 domain-containing protein [Leptolyngbya sp. NK1-12]|uniref:DUF2294 domain-containing protein n=1 Tax=Leptolyngbya sp. NK1-12 TaxID=2547451 RepID=A0AA96WE16_9CYAN|nr:DUF2294 domain-containing protein [Leptolyngbya sp. NK1-12]WNZ23413.1 DUF2294 domain-containing protein [Leptolyngbya sp. NK1-12]